MNAFAEAGQAVIGWLDLIAGRAGAAERFNPTRRGLINAVGCYVAVAVLGPLVATLLGAGPGWVGGLVYLLLQVPPLLCIWLVIWLTALVVRPASGMLGIVVCATYAMAFIEVIGLCLAPFAGPALNNALLGALAFVLYRIGRMVGGYGIGVSVAFAALGAAALVTETIGLYMLLTGGRGFN